MIEYLVILTERNNPCIIPESSRISPQMMNTIDTLLQVQRTQIEDLKNQEREMISGYETERVKEGRIHQLKTCISELKQKLKGFAVSPVKSKNSKICKNATQQSKPKHKNSLGVVVTNPSKDMIAWNELIEKEKRKTDKLRKKIITAKYKRNQAKQCLKEIKGVNIMLQKSFNELQRTVSGRPCSKGRPKLR
ncbi:unnamed protein product [Moneuplotes crassus]|uniref:Uncharacterized protein n=1 Tax=Euplotes crassus TaxID=5936 RepID=A0AAD1UIN2_EUPCR|nr:unnamed protein product [Moneuplotes crassus]